MNDMDHNILLAVIENVDTRCHSGTCQAFLRAQLARKKGRLTILSGTQGTTKRLPGFLWIPGGEDEGSPQLHLRLLNGDRFSVPSPVARSSCVVRKLTTTASCLPYVAASMPSISTLCLSNFKGGGIFDLECLPNLTHLRLDLWEECDAVSSSIGTALFQKTKLRSLELWQPGGDLLETVGRMTWLETLKATLNIDHHRNAPKLAALAHVRGLRLELDYMHRRDDDTTGDRGFADIARSLGDLTGLESLWIRKDDDTGDMPNSIRTMGASLAKLEHLTELDVCLDFADRYATTGLESLIADLRHLRTLVLSEFEHGRLRGFSDMTWASTASALGGLTELSISLQMDGKMVSSVPWHSMASHLEVLSVRGCNFRGGGLLILAKGIVTLSALRRLDASNTEVTDEIAAEVACSLLEMKCVEHVKLTDNHITASMGRLIRLTLRSSITLEI